MSDQVAINRQSTCDKHTCDRNMHKTFLSCAEARWAPKLPIFESQCVCKRAREHARLTIMYNNQATYQTIHFKHNNNITWTKQSWDTIHIRCDQLTGPHGFCQILRCWYKSQPPCSPVSPKSEE